MKESLSLHVPACEELWYRRKIMQDPETMSYNKGYDLNFEGYDKETGCIAFPKRQWADWHARFIGQEPRNFYAYIVREPDGEWIGEVNVHKAADADWYEMGIVLEAKYRGRGYAADALRLLLQHAFERMGAKAIHNDFEEERRAAVQAHLAAGFTKYRQENGVIELLITREQYFQAKSQRAGNVAADPYRIRMVGPEELDRAFALIWDVFKQFVAPDYTQEGVDYFYSRFVAGQAFREGFLNHTQTMYGSFDGDRLVGVLAISENHHVSCVFVDGAYHRKGIAAKLFSRVISERKEQGAEQIRLNASPYAVPFYHALGFQDTGTEAVHHGIRYTPMELWL